jgi:hypothetical protein
VFRSRAIWRGSGFVMMEMSLESSVPKPFIALRRAIASCCALP